jgi:hypothetical protein
MNCAIFGPRKWQYIVYKIFKISVFQGSVLCRIIFLISINDFMPDVH